MTTKQSRAQASNSSAADLTLVETFAAAMPGPGDESPIAPAFVIPGVSTEFPPALHVAAEKMESLAAAVAKARAGAENLDSKAAELRLRAVTLKDEIERVGGSAAAAVAMGIETADPAREARVAAKIAELAAVEKDIADTARARASAPALFEDFRAPLTEAVADFERQYAEIERQHAQWAADALEALSHATAQVRHFADGIQRCGEIAARSVHPQVEDGHPMAVFPQLARFHSAYKAAVSANHPLAGKTETNAEAVERLRQSEMQRERVVSFSGGRR